MDPGTQTIAWAGAGAAALWLAVMLFRRLRVVAQPDEWLLRVRNGRMVEAGVGIVLWRRPGDVVVRFSSTLQRVGFSVDALSLERVPVRLEGFVFWSVGAEGDAPFRAFSRLGIANTLSRFTGLKHPKHLLTAPQHKAFQQILTASVQRLAATASLERLLGEQDALVAELTVRLRATTEDMGVHIDQVQVQNVRPTDGRVLSELAARETERIREAAARARAEVAERIAHAETEAQTRQAQREAESRRERAEAERAVALRSLEIEHERQVAEAASELALARARAARQAAEVEAEGERLRRRAEAERDAMRARASAEEGKSAAVREHELAVLVAEKVGAALKLTDARWVTVGAQSPAASVGAMIAGVREMLAPHASEDTTAVRRGRGTAGES